MRWACCFCWHEVLAQRGRFARFYYFNWCYYSSFFRVDRKEKVSSSSRIAPAEKKKEKERKRERKKERKGQKKKAFIRHYHSIVIVRSFGVISVDELGTGMSVDFDPIVLSTDEENTVHDACVK